MKTSWLFLLFFICSNELDAQSKQKPQYKDQWTVRFNPMGLVDVFDGNLSAGITYSLNHRWLVSADLSYIFYSTYLSNTRGTSGYIFKPALRYYLADSRKVFIESTAWYKRSSYRVVDWVDKDCINGVPSYQEFKSFHFRKRVAGFNVQGGFQRGLMKSNLLRMEIYAGIGVRFRWQDIKDDPNACYQPNDILFGPLYGRYNVTASLPHGLRLVWVVR